MVSKETVHLPRGTAVAKGNDDSVLTASGGGGGGGGGGGSGGSVNGAGGAGGLGGSGGSADTNGTGAASSSITRGAREAPATLARLRTLDLEAQAGPGSPGTTEATAERETAGTAVPGRSLMDTADRRCTIRRSD